MYYTQLPKIKGFHCAVDMDESYGELNCVDDWDAAYLCDGNQLGVVYNFYYDGKHENSAFYKSDGFFIDETTYEPYEIDFGFDDWKDRLIDAMIKAYHEFWDEK